MNIAILIGVDKYNMPGNDLPGCIKDINIMNELITNLNKFDDILLINKNENTKDIKDKILDFIQKYSSEQTTIEDFFFYFTGHGIADENDFYYLLSDCSPNKLKQTSLENSELDTWIRKLSPSTTIKVVDACYSGMSYIKDINPIKDLLDNTKKQINKCYFMYSSQFNQTSEQADISFFTESFINAILKSPNGNLRYKEIMDYISDDFKSNERQKPYFVSQGDYTEVFGDITSELKEKIITSYRSSSNASQNDTKKTNSTIIERIEDDAKRYCSEEEMISNIKNIQEFLSEHIIEDSTLNQVYDYKCEFSQDYPDEINLIPIGDWIEKNNSFFAKPTYEKEYYQDTVQVERKNPYAALLGAGFGNKLYEDKQVTKHRYVLRGFELTQEVPYNCIKISYTPKYENLRYYSSFILFAFSKTEIVFFVYTSYYKELNWKERILNKENNWDISTTGAKNFDDISTYLNKITKSTEDAIISEIETKFKVLSLDLKKRKPL